MSTTGRGSMGGYWLASIRNMVAGAVREGVDDATIYQAVYDSIVETLVELRAKAGG